MGTPEPFVKFSLYPGHEPDPITMIEIVIEEAMQELLGMGIEPDDIAEFMIRMADILKGKLEDVSEEA